ncbi:MAG: XRE family transcriptional regulator [Lachnospiraceae bacterium]|nr:XRE family transcriptional regulator [Lachnospiraceae bacterium]
MNEGNLKSISEKLEIINLQLIKRSEMRMRTIRYFFISVCTIIVTVFIAFAAINSEYLTWNFNNPELAVAGTFLHGFEFLFVRLAPFVFIGSVIGIIVTYKKR